MTCESALKLAVLKNRRKAVALKIEERAVALWRLESGACVVGGEWQSSSCVAVGSWTIDPLVLVVFVPSYTAIGRHRHFKKVFLTCIPTLRVGIPFVVALSHATSGRRTPPEYGSASSEYQLGARKTPLACGSGGLPRRLAGIPPRVAVFLVVLI